MMVNIFYEVMGNIFHHIGAFAVLFVFPAMVLLHGIYHWGRGECVMMAFSRWLGS